MAQDLRTAPHLVQVKQLRLEGFGTGAALEWPVETGITRQPRCHLRTRKFIREDEFDVAGIPQPQALLRQSLAKQRFAHW
jgi:hypothetical protein